MRTKEVEQEYRYFPEPDMVPMVFSEAVLSELRAGLPELPEARRARLVAEYGIGEDEAALFVEEGPLADWFEEAARAAKKPREVANWVRGDFLRLLSEGKVEAGESRVTPKHFTRMLELMEAGTINRTTARTVFEEMFRTGKTADEVVAAKGLTQIADEGAIAALVDEALAKNPKEVERFRAGEEKLKAFFVGQVMRASRGQANAELVNRLLDERLKIASPSPET
jgi:aspartyl-tRNA(Asn)/glutamyl-tRNA(Gln) amidotransferase subunit B